MVTASEIEESDISEIVTPEITTNDAYSREFMESLSSDGVMPPSGDFIPDCLTCIKLMQLTVDNLQIKTAAVKPKSKLQIKKKLK
jgi:hypothetical protein